MPKSAPAGPGAVHPARKTWGSVERVHPSGIRVDHQACGGEGDAIRNAAVAFVQARDPGLPDRKLRHRLAAQNDESECQQPAIDPNRHDIFEEMLPAKPQGGCFLTH